MLNQIGRAHARASSSRSRACSAFFGDVVLSALGLLKEPKTGNWKDVLPTMERTGADAVPIVVLINFLVGFVMAFQARRPAQAVRRQHLRRRPGRPLDHARARAADDGDHRLRPLRRRVRRRARHDEGLGGDRRAAHDGLRPACASWSCRASLALMLVLPLLTLLADLVGIAGGLRGRRSPSLDLTVDGYLHRDRRRRCTLWDVFSGRHQERRLRPRHRAHRLPAGPRDDAAAPRASGGARPPRSSSIALRAHRHRRGLHRALPRASTYERRHSSSVTDLTIGWGDVVLLEDATFDGRSAARSSRSSAAAAAASRRCCAT